MKYVFEKWETQQPTHGRSLLRSVIHTLVVTLAPSLPEWLEIGLLKALGLDFGLVALFVFYAFNWAFDQIFGLRQSAQLTWSARPG